VAATAKHYVANDSETDRFTVDVRVDERTLRELYLAPFEQLVRDGGAWLAMAAYSGVNGATMTESPLLADPLKREWGFDGVVVSDWSATRSTEASARAALDLVMPGPHGPWGGELVAAVRQGRVPEAAVDDKVRRLLQLAARVGRWRASTRPRPHPSDRRRRRGPRRQGPAAQQRAARRPRGRAGLPLPRVLGGRAAHRLARGLRRGRRPARRDGHRRGPGRGAGAPALVGGCAPVAGRAGPVRADRRPLRRRPAARHPRHRGRVPGSLNLRRGGAFLDALSARAGRRP
jgi:beta-glucosidase